VFDPKKYPAVAVVLASDDDSDATYKIVRNYKDDHPSKVQDTGLSLEEAREWCKDPETSSSKCKKPENVKHTEKYGAWFDGYDKE
jgi:hypothetical protein